MIISEGRTGLIVRNTGTSVSMQYLWISENVMPGTFFTRMGELRWSSAKNEPPFFLLHFLVCEWVFHCPQGFLSVYRHSDWEVVLFKLRWPWFGFLNLTILIRSRVWYDCRVWCQTRPEIANHSVVSPSQINDETRFERIKTYIMAMTTLLRNGITNKGTK